MKRILILTRDAQFTRDCLSKLGFDGYRLDFVSNGKDALDRLANHGPTDLAIIHSNPTDDDHLVVLEILKQAAPSLRTIITSTYFDFWHDCGCWMADACVVATSDLSELRDKIAAVLTGRNVEKNHRETDLRFSVDWN